MLGLMTYIGLALAETTFLAPTNTSWWAGNRNLGAFCCDILDSPAAGDAPLLFKPLSGCRVAGAACRRQHWVISALMTSEELENFSGIHGERH